VEKKARKKKSQARLRRKSWKVVVEVPEVERAYWIMGDPITFARQKGQFAEKMAWRILKHLQQRKVEFSEVGVIVSVTPTPHLSPEDERAIDIEIGFWSETIFVEVKAHPWTEKEARRWLDRNRCFIGIPWNVSNEEAEEMVHYALTWFLDNRTKKAEANLSERAIRRASFSLYGLTSFFRSFNIKK